MFELEKSELRTEKKGAPRARDIHFLREECFGIILPKAVERMSLLNSLNSSDMLAKVIKKDVMLFIKF